MVNGRREHQAFGRAYDDGWRSATVSWIGTVVVGGGFAALLATGLVPPLDAANWLPVFLALASVFWIVFVIGYLAWTHVLFSRTPREEQLRIADVQHHRTPSPWATVLLGQGASGTGTISAATTALVLALGLAMVGREQMGLMLLPLTVLTVAASWAAMVYSYALRYLRLHAGGERITFDIDEAPEFTDFVAMSVTISAASALSAGTPRTRSALRAVRSHALFAFVFNAFIVAMAASLVVSFILA